MINIVKSLRDLYKKLTEPTVEVMRWQRPGTKAQSNPGLNNNYNPVVSSRKDPDIKPTMPPMKYPVIEKTETGVQEQNPAAGTKVEDGISGLNASVEQRRRRMTPIFNEVFEDPQVAGNMLRVLQNENATLNPKAENKNRDGSVDRGIFQINSRTFNKMMSHGTWGPVMQKMGITSFDDMFDPVLNTKMANIIYRERESWDPKGGYAAWYGAPDDLINR